jgi:tRNA A-37 threonylcarbamoyl transferase component Bud32
MNKRVISTLEENSLITYLEDIYISITDINNTFDLFAFVDFINLPFFISERLFYTFSNSKSILTRDDFIKGMLLLYNNNNKEKICEFVFDLLENINSKTNKIFKSDILMLTNLLHIENTQINKNAEEFCVTDFKEYYDIYIQIYHSIIENIPSIKFVPTYYYFSANIRQNRYYTAQEKFKNQGLDEMIDFPKISSYSEDNIFSFNKIRLPTVKEELYASEEIQKLPLTKIINIGVGSNAKFVTHKLLKNDKNNQTCFYNEITSNMEGYVFKQTKKGDYRKYFLRLIDRGLFYFDVNNPDWIRKCKYIPRYNIADIYIADEGLSDDCGCKNLSNIRIKFIENSKEYSFFCNTSDVNKWLNSIKENCDFREIADNCNVLKQIAIGKNTLISKGQYQGDGVVIKTYNKAKLSKDDRLLIANEIDLLKLCKHDNIIKFKDAFEDIYNIYIINEDFGGMPLNDFIFHNYHSQIIPEDTAKRICFEIAKGLKYLQQVGIVHRDLNPNNIVINRDKFTGKLIVKIIDFGFSVLKFPSAKLYGLVGTNGFIAPEIFELCYDGKADVWSFGAICFFILTKYYYNHITKGYIYNNKSDEAVDLVTKCLKPYSDERITIEEVLGDPWFDELL